MNCCENLQEIRERYEAFWHGEILDRPLIKVRTLRTDVPPAIPEDSRPLDSDDLFDWFMNPKRVIPRLRRQVAKTYYAGDAFPLVFPVSCHLTAIQAAYLGGEYSTVSGTGWCDPIIDDWEKQDPFKMDAENEWWRLSRKLIEEVTKAMEGEALFGIPDLQGGGQVLASLRGTESLAVDLIDNPDVIQKVMEEIDTSWFQYWKKCNDIILQYQDSYVDWLTVWSDKPAVTVECDFSTMISAEMFREFFLPSLERQTTLVERTIYHLDGEGAIHHLDALLSLETLGGIQWVPSPGGPGGECIADWIPMLQRIQNAGKLLVFWCGAQEIKVLLTALRPGGVFFITQCDTPEEADALIESHKKITKSTRG